MKLFALFFSLTIVFNGCSNPRVPSNLKSGFDANEARDLIQICNSFSYIDLHGSDSEILPKNYKKFYTSPVYGMDNKFQIYTKQDASVGVIHFRGSTSKQISWLENLYASMIPVKDKISINDDIFKYQLGEQDESHVHAGYTLAIYFMKDDLLKQISELNKQGIYDFYITGHSQGGALAQVFRAYFDYLPNKELNKKNTFKVYAFANPMIGNTSFSNEYYKKYGEGGMSYLIHNSDDFVTKLPISYNDSTFWSSHLSELLSNKDEFSTTNFALEGALNLFKSKINDVAIKMSKNIESKLLENLGEIKMPLFHTEINYVHTGNIINIPPTEYPLELKDSSILKNDSLMAIYSRDDNGVFENKSLYKKSKPTLQHKSYNYYTAILKKYFLEEYSNLKEKYFIHPENKR